MEQPDSHSSVASRSTDSLVRWHGLAALASVVYVVLVGIVMALKLHEPEWLAAQPWLTWGRIRYAHTQGVFFGWLGNAFLAFLYYVTPRLANRPVTSPRLGWLLFFVWNVVLVLPGSALVHAGVSQPLEWAEYPVAIDAAAILGLALAVAQFALPLSRARVPALYVSAWYILGGLVFTLLAYPVGNFAPELLPGARGATLSGLWIHDAVGLYATPLALAVAYAVIPSVSRRPIYSHFLSMIGFWVLFLIYPLNGTHHYVFSSIPMEAQKGAIVASVYLGADVILVVTNLLLSLRGSAGVVARDVPLRFVWFGVVAYLIVSLQGSAQAIMPVNRLVHFSDWVIGHSHLAMIGFASFLAIGGLLEAWRRTPGCRYHPGAANWAFWLIAVGLAVMVVDLTAAGLVQGILWRGDAPWIDSVEASRGFWMVRSVSGLIILAGFAALVVAMTTGMGLAAVDPIADEVKEEINDVPAGLHWLGGAYAVVAVAGLGIFAFSFVALGLWPNEVLRAEIARSMPPHRPRLSASEIRGRAIYGREGCLNCHSQLVRFDENDVRRFGVVSQAWESEADYPQLWGTRRIGPDLAREGQKRSRDWQLAHLWNPRQVVPLSVMPGYPWLFDGAAREPRREALDLLNYLESLGREARLAGASGPLPLAREELAREGQADMFCDCAIPRTAGTAPVWSIPTEPGERERFTRRGVQVFATHCVGCHGAAGLGDGPAAEALSPAPRNLTSARMTPRAISEILWNGRPGSSMPPWNELASGDLRALVVYLDDLARPSPVVALSGPDRAVASRLFKLHCAVCHGPDGKGDGQAAMELNPRPTNFHEARPTLDWAASAIENGVPGAAMPRWKEKLGPTEQRLLASYIRLFFQGE